MARVTFKVNGIKRSVGCEVSSTTTLVDYLRRTCELRGTKYMCCEGGCGACIVSVIKKTGDKPKGINSCMVTITSCQDWDITTIEKVGNRLEGYHKLQTTLAEANGTQCGYCSPGMVMNMYSHLQSTQLTMLEIEKSLGSNICRCTGYIPILKAFQKFGSDAPVENRLSDIEDLKICNKSGNICSQQTCDESDWCLISDNETDSEIIHITLKDNRDWYRANTLSDVFAVWKTKGVDSYMLVAGNTAKGIEPILEYPKLLIDISSVSELKGHYIDQNLVIRAGTTLTEVINIFTTEVVNDGFSYLSVMKQHVELIANITIRNLGSLAGNLMLKHDYSFKSDVFLILEMIGARITIMKGVGKKQVLSMQDFLKEDMKGKILVNVLLPPLSSENKMVSYKIMPRFLASHALIHGGFLYKIDGNNRVLESRIVIGGLSTQFMRAYKTELYLKNKILFVNETLSGALEVLNDEMVVVECLPDPSAEYLRQAALNLFYKSLLALCPENKLGPRYRSGATKLRDSRPVSSALAVYDTNPALWPLTQPSPKFEALIQCAGEAKYTDDIPVLPGEVFMSYVLAKVPLGTIESIDASKALSDPEVIAFYSASDIPGKNSFTPNPNEFTTADEEIFCDGEVKYYDQPIGVIVAESQSVANKAATLVEVKYSNVKSPVIDVKVAKKDSSRVSVYTSVEATKKGSDVVKVISGTNTLYSQYPFPMETIVSVVHPTEDGLKIYATTQWLDMVHQTVSRALNIDQSRIVVANNRSGGGFGFKVSRTNQNAVTCALVCYKLNRPCRFIYPLVTNIRVVGKRMPCSRDFEVGVNASGVIQYVNYDLYTDNGYIYNEPIIALGVDVYNNCYRKDSWKYTAYNVITDTASNTFFRSPGTLEAVSMVETMIEQIAYELNLDPLEVRLANLDTENYGDLKEMLETLKTSSQYAERKTKVEIFNKNNMLKKRGIQWCFLRWVPTGYQNFDVNLSVYADDGTVVITHGGVEMGQGINTKAIQICAYMLKISVDRIKVKLNNTVIAPNGTCSGGSISSQNVALGVRRCCEELLKRLEPIKNQMTNPTWVELIKKAYDEQVDLQAHGCTDKNDVQNYTIYGVTLAEVELDVLTAEWQILQVDLIEDAGQSVNPELDIGQIQGAFMMGLGYATTENIVYNSSTGEILTNRALEYWVLQAADIPQVFNTYLKKRSYSSDIIFGSKATGEPATCMSVAVNFAMRAAIASARLDSGIPTTEWFQIDGPYSVENICMSMAKKCSEFKFY